LVLFDKSRAKTSKEAREWTYYALSESPGFLQNDSGEFSFGSSMCDWFVIGGRWSGDLNWACLDKDKEKEFWEEFEKEKLGWMSGDDKKQEAQKQKAEELFRKYFPDYKGPKLLFRDTYAGTGHPDDAKIVDKQIYDRLIKKYEGEYMSPGESDEFVNLESDEIKPIDVIGMKWIVVVDYHM
jgi:hypothetical protein